jgi:hypothetical protein
MVISLPRHPAREDFRSPAKAGDRLATPEHIDCCEGGYSIVRGHPFATTRAGLLGENIEAAHYTENSARGK